MDRRLLALALGMFALGTDTFVVAGVLPGIARSYHVGIGAAGQMTTVYAVTLALAAPVVATFAAGVSRKSLLLTGLVLFVLANLGTALAPSLAIALATRALAGLGAATFAPAASSAAIMIVPPERRGFALSMVVIGMTSSTALGAPLGTLIAGFSDWQWTMVFVAVLAGLAGFGVMIFLSNIPSPASVTLTERLVPLADSRVVLTLVTTFLFYSGAFTIYTYFAAAFGRVIGGDQTLLSGLLLLWGAAGTMSSLFTGRLVDRFGNRRVLSLMLSVVVADFVLLPWSSAYLLSAIPAIILWGACGWGVGVPQQYRLVGIAPALASVTLGLNSSATFLGTTAAGIVGALVLQAEESEKLGYVAASLAAAALIAAEIAAKRIGAIDARTRFDPPSGASSNGALDRAKL